MKAETRRTFLDRAIKTVGLLGLTGGAAGSREDEPSAAVGMVGKAVNFLRHRRADDGSWSGDRKEPGITALVVTALLRSGQVTPSDPVTT
jgi:squalene-hopene/tetraprenyl-beta-curcumene cyclase